MLDAFMYVASSVCILMMTHNMNKHQKQHEQFVERELVSIVLLKICEI